MRLHNQIEQRSRCTRCGQTFAATTGPPFSRGPTAADLVIIVHTRFCHGCPTYAMLAAFGLDERTVATWVVRAGWHGPQGHQHLVQPGQVDLQHVQADEWWVTRVGRRVWRAMALAVPSRLWLGGVISPLGLAAEHPLGQRVRACARTLALLVGVDGLASSVTACLRVFRRPGVPEASRCAPGAGGAPSPTLRASRPQGCGWWGVPTTSVGGMHVSDCRRRREPHGDGRSARQRWPPG